MEVRSCAEASNYGEWKEKAMWLKDTLQGPQPGSGLWRS